MARGCVLAAARALALVTCVVMATDPPRSAASTRIAGVASPMAATATNAPPIGRITVWTASHSESSHGILSTDELHDIHRQRDADHERVIESAELIRQRDQSVARTQAQDRDGRVDVQA